MCEARFLRLFIDYSWLFSGPFTLSFFLSRWLYLLFQYVILVCVCANSLQPLTQQGSAWLSQGGEGLHITPCSQENGNCLGTSHRYVTLLVEAAAPTNVPSAGIIFFCAFFSGAEHDSDGRSCLVERLCHGCLLQFHRPARTGEKVHRSTSHVKNCLIHLKYLKMLNMVKF